MIPLHLLVQSQAVTSSKSSRSRSPQPFDPRTQPLTAVQHGSFGAVSGALAALMGVGGLPIAMSYLTLSTDLPHHVVQGTAVLAVAPSALTSMLSRLHVVPLASAAAVTAGAMTGAGAGVSVALQLSEERLRQLYTISLVVLGGRSALRAGQNLRSLWTQHIALKAR